MPRRPAPVPVPLSSTSFPSTSTEPWMPYSRTRARDVQHPFHAVAAHQVDLADLVQLAYAYRHRAHEVVAISHGSAARLHTLPLPMRLENEAALHVCRLDAGRAPRGRGIRGHRWQIGTRSSRTELLFSPSTAELLPIRLLTPIAAAATLASVLSLDDLVAVLDACVRECDAGPAASLLHHGLLLVRNRPGAARFARAVPLVRTGVRSRAETLLRLMIKRARLPEPAVAMSVITPVGELHPDLQWSNFGVVLEYEGDGHRISVSQFRRDIVRFDAYLDAALSPVRATADDLYVSPRRLMNVLERRLRQRGWRPHSRWSLRVPLPAVR